MQLVMVDARNLGISQDLVATAGLVRVGER